ncbi:28S ribosomal protein S24, mitochondrial [Lingula anatina]|uniref:28S ribosomal protein S24, mitochondrial n=1 Tax=Lingula anatina TaxID=7574 RepID=A0A1S3KH84_LINAN|nr:28S ribosomal protein S24, mitochondrial [Lingula anatina]|eukprot:XP_013421990.1 28S ribosomal protein S24, mitochondrial [Lingula anatina]
MRTAAERRAMLTNSVLLAVLQRTCNTCPVRGIKTSAVYLKNRRAAIPKRSAAGNHGILYEKATAPHHLGVRKGWLTWNTSNLYGESRSSETALEDAYIRKLLSELMGVNDYIIKRKYNVITVSAAIPPRKGYNLLFFQIGFAEEFLTTVLQCPVKVDFIVRGTEDLPVLRYI